MKHQKCPRCGSVMQFPDNQYLGRLVCPNIFCPNAEYAVTRSILLSNKRIRRRTISLNNSKER